MKLQDLKDYIGERCDRIETRLDTLNGRVVDHGEMLADHGARLKSVEKDVFTPKENDDARPALTKRDVKLLALIVSGAAGVVGFAVEVFHRIAHLMGKP